jgi:hypothetical protein
MRPSCFSAIVITSAVSLTLLAGCSSDSTTVSSIPAQQAASIPARAAAGSIRYPLWMRFADPESKKKKRGAFAPYVATMNSNESSGSFVAQYGNHDPSGNQLCSLPGEDSQYIGGIAADSSDDLYVPQSIASYTQIYEYAPHCGNVLNTLTYSGGNQPQDVAVYGSTVYSIDASYRDPKVQIFANGSSAPTGTLSDSSIYQDFALAVDSGGDVFLSYYSTTGSYAVVEFPGGAMPGSILPVTGNGPDGLLVDKSNNLLYVVGGSNNWEVNVYAPPYTGSPTETIALKGSSPNQNGPEYCSLGMHYTLLTCGDGAYKTLDTYKYPSGTYVYSLLLPYSGYSLTYSVANDPTP